VNLLFATVCVILFSLTMPATRLATQSFEAEAVALIRLLGAALVCLVAVVAFDRWTPPRRHWGRLLLVSVASVSGFSLLTALAMKRVPSTHGAVALAALPAATALYASLRDRLNPGLRFWLFGLIGTGIALTFFALTSEEGIHAGDWLLAGAVASAAFGYVEGGRLSREHGGRRVMSWAILTSLPISLLGAVFLLPGRNLPSLEEAPASWIAVGYLALISQSLGMFLWYRVLAIGPMAQIAMVQLLQPFFSLLAAMLLLSEHVSAGTWAMALLVGLCVLGSSRNRGLPPAHPRPPRAASNPA
jgi:drug/metabolite transporter (DMT)-like permease